MDSVALKTSPSGSRVYHQFAGYYDRVFSSVYERRIQDTIRALNIQPGEKVLEVGIGTGFSLPAYPKDAHVVGIDLSESMLKKAEARASQSPARNIQLMQMNALNLEFDENEFDYVMAFHVVSVIDDVERLMKGIHRVCKPEGKIVIINHFRSERWWVAPIVDMISPVTKKLGWRTTLRRETVYQSIPLRVEREYKTSPASLFTVAIGEKLDISQ